MRGNYEKRVITLSLFLLCNIPQSVNGLNRSDNILDKCLVQSHEADCVTASVDISFGSHCYDRVLLILR